MTEQQTGTVLVPWLCECLGWCYAPLQVPIDVANQRAAADGELVLVSAECAQWEPVDGLPADEVLESGDGWALCRAARKGSDA